MMHNNSSFTVIIPARMQSSRLPNKMTLNIGGLPMVVQTAKQAIKSNAHKVVVATDHANIVQLCNEHNIEVVMTKSTHNSGTDRLAEATELLNLKPEETVINVQGDEPLINPDLINQLAEFIAHKNAEVATIAHPIFAEDEIFNPNVVKVVIDKFNNALYFSRAAIPYYRDGFNKDTEFKLPVAVHILRHIGIYGYSVKFLKQYHQIEQSPLEQVECLEQLRVMYNGYKIAVLVSQSTPPSGIDTIEDLEKVRQIIGNNEYKY